MRLYKKTQKGYRRDKNIRDSDANARNERRKHNFTKNLIVSDDPCDCDGDHNSVIVLDDEQEPIEELCPIIYWLRWKMFSDDDPDLFMYERLLGTELNYCRRAVQ